jgi:benzoyl-CoA reductase subunit D
MAGRYLKLLRSIGAEGTVAITGGLAADVGLAQALRETIAAEKLAMDVVTDPRAIYAGAIGAALWGAFRHEVLSRRSVA